MSWAYRPSLDGVRALAVYLVVAYHSGIVAVEGGFIGVDIFFVLSGFLVCSILLVEHDETGRVRLLRFYARRVRRLLPAALVVIVSTAALFVLFTSSVRRIPLVDDARAASLYAANWRFIAQSEDYFGSGEVGRSPYLHFWSLSIEEQFYVVFPLLLMCLALVARRYRHAVAVAVGIAFVSSLIAQIVWSTTDVNRAYYGTDTRAYQLLAGVGLALWWRARLAAKQASTTETSPKAATPVVVAALLAILLVASRVVELNPTYRGAAATAACVALIAALMAAPQGWPALLLGRPLPTYLGLISYGIYLWHWPIILLLQEVLTTSPLVIAVLTAALATAMASLSFHVLEHPIRTSKWIAAHGRTVIAVGLAGSVAAAVLAPVVLESPRRPALTSRTVLGNDAGAKVPAGIDWTDYQYLGPDDTYCGKSDLDSCVVARGSSGLHVALVGDSNARMMVQAFEQLADEHDFTLSLDVLFACSWQHEVLQDHERNAKCQQNGDDLYSGVLEQMDVDLVVLVQAPRDRFEYLAGARRAGSTVEEFDAFNAESMRSTLNEITAQGVRAIMIRPVMQVSPDLPDPLECVAQAVRTGECRIPVPILPTPSAAFEETLGVTTAGVSSITINDLICPDAPVCEPILRGTPVWRDRKHLTPDIVSQVRARMWTRVEESASLG